MRIGIVGFGNFGQFLAKTFVKHGHAVSATSRTDYTACANALGVSFTTDVNEFCRAQPDCVIFSTSIMSLDQVVSGIPLNTLIRENPRADDRQLFVDVLSVKIYPKEYLLRILPADRTDLLCTHPMLALRVERTPGKDCPWCMRKFGLPTSSLTSF
eukprot:EC121611.1.p1 GENE.EC121611.1~~EC121611.1.p1  ORF type:complete len:156 (+),score=11.65 EC121611.1:27-494(+)